MQADKRVAEREEGKGNGKEEWRGGQGESMVQNQDE